MSDVKDRGYFFSVYMRTPGGALFELAEATGRGFLIDETAQQALGTHMCIPPHWEDRRPEIAQLEQLEHYRDGGRRSPVVSGPPPEEARAAAVLLHGRDQDPEYMLEDLVAPLGFEDVRLRAPRLGGGGGGNPGRYFDTRVENEPAIDEALEACEEAVAGLVAADMPTDRIVLAGFSQGACVLADFLAHAPAAWSAWVALLTGSLLGPDGHMTPVRPLGGVPVYLCSSEHDDWVEAGACARHGGGAGGGGRVGDAADHRRTRARDLF